MSLWDMFLGAWVAQALKHALGHSSKLDMFRWVVGFKVLVSRLMFCSAWFSTDENECQVAIKT
jgi:hypothetical protein